MHQKGFDLLKEKKYGDALTFFDSYLNQKDLPDLKQFHYGKARALIELERYEEAKSILDNLIKRYPTWSVPYITLARMYENLMFLASAETVYRNVLEKLPDDTNAKEHYNYFLKNNVKEGDYIQCSRVYLPGVTLQRKVADDEGEIVDKMVALFVENTGYSMKPRV